MKNAKLKIISLINVFFIFLFIFVCVNPVIAQGTAWSQQEGLGKNPSIMSSMFGGGDKPKDLRDMVVDIIRTLLTLSALFLTVLIILAGLRWMNSRGNEDELTKAKAQLKNAIIGMIITISAYAIMEIVIKLTQKAIKGDVLG